MNGPQDPATVEMERLKALYRSASDPPAGPHPSEDDWVRLAADDLSAEARAALADHIVFCSECRDTYRVVMDVRTQAASIDNGAVAPPIASREPDTFAEASPAFAGRRWRNLALAAAVLAAVGAGAWAWSLRARVGALEGQLASMRPSEDIARLEAAVRDAENRRAQLERQLSEQQQPGVNAPIVDFEPQAVRGDQRRQTEVVVPDAARYVVLVFTFTAGTAAGAPFTIELTRADGTRVGAWPGVAAGAYQTASVVVPTAIAPPGEYLVQLRDASGAAVQTHALVVRTPATR